MDKIKLSLFLGVMIVGFAIIRPYIFTPESSQPDRMIAAETITLDQQQFVFLETEKAFVFFRDGDPRNILKEIPKDEKTSVPARIETTTDGSLIIRTDGEVIKVTAQNDKIQYEKL
ncbi:MULTISPECIES: hypothetical protein [Brevibacillus]|uniref:hypothetical protein n=1 Tax=Brevibacillus TaxID=55080 RepID=UPI00203BDE46|nr:MULTISPECIES: hypothetical protein [Brevibacillus]MCM3625623.1 hypothetical protein [Brevibacillus borstelensis]MDH4620034.1 hypothetical protein [Brevibacillus sp. AY1]